MSEKSITNDLGACNSHVVSSRAWNMNTKGQFICQTVSPVGLKLTGHSGVPKRATIISEFVARPGPTQSLTLTLLERAQCHMFAIYVQMKSITK